MIWQTIDPNNLPKQKVLAACFIPKSAWFKEKLIGYLVFYQKSIFCIETSNLIVKTIGSCTHYIDIEAETPDDIDSSTYQPSQMVDALCGQSTLPIPPGKILAAAIEETGVCPSKFAEMLGVHPKTVLEFILGYRPISSEMGILIGDALGMDDRQWFELQQKIVVARCENECIGIKFMDLP
jgi:plasmid maintenance system antidote protein VapI